MIYDSIILILYAYPLKLSRPHFSPPITFVGRSGSRVPSSIRLPFPTTDRLE